MDRARVDLRALRSVPYRTNRCSNFNRSFLPFTLTRIRARRLVFLGQGRTRSNRRNRRANQRGLSRAHGADDRDDFAASDAERQVSQRRGRDAHRTVRKLHHRRRNSHLLAVAIHIVAPTRGGSSLCFRVRLCIFRVGPRERNI